MGSASGVASVLRRIADSMDAMTYLTEYTHRHRPRSIFAAASPDELAAAGSRR